VDRQKNRDNRYTLIEKKREMFRVAQELNLKDKEVRHLENYSKMRNIGLVSSARMLE
jgi:response regulator RpfG family c-di-GMP phosphodiesterase